MPATAEIASNFFGNKLYQQRARMALPILVRQGEAGNTIYYADLARELGMANARNLNFVLGCVGDALNDLSRQWNSEIPHIQSLVVNQQSETPGEGFDTFLLDRGEHWSSDDERWAVLETYWARIKAYPHWGRVLRDLGLERAESRIDDLITKASGLGGGEGPEHAALKEFVRTHPSVIGLRQDHPFGQAEHPLPSGDRIDVVFCTSTRFDSVEVKPAGCGEADVVRGLFQCVKYAAVVEARARFDQVETEVNSWLVLGGTFPERLVPLRNSLGITVIENISTS